MTVETKPVLVDTSIWVELLRRSSHPARFHIENLLAEDRARLCAAVAAELIQGSTTAKDLAAAEGLAQAVPFLEASDNTWMAAGRLSQKLRLKGITVGLLDCYLAELAMSHRCLILSLDKHFPLISKYSSLELASLT